MAANSPTQLTVPLPSRVDARIGRIGESSQQLDPLPRTPDRFLLSLERCELIDSRPGQHVLPDYSQRSLTLLSLSLSIPHTEQEQQTIDIFLDGLILLYIRVRRLYGLLRSFSHEKTTSTLHFFTPRSSEIKNDMRADAPGAQQHLLRFSSFSLSLCSFGC